MAFRIELDRGILRVIFSGQLSRADLLSLYQEVSRFEAPLPRVPDRIVELSGITGSDVEYAHMLDVIQRRLQVQLPNPIRTAIVVERPVQVGYARMFQSLNEHPQITIRLFTTMAEAEAWVLGDATPPQ